MGRVRGRALVAPIKAKEPHKPPSQSPCAHLDNNIVLVILDSEQFRPHASPSAKARQRSAFRRQTAIAAPPAHAREPGALISRAAGGRRRGCPRRAVRAAPS